MTTVLRRLVPQRRADEARNMPPQTMLDELARVVYNGGQVTLSGTSRINGALAHAVVWRAVNKVSNLVSSMPWEAERDGRNLNTLPRLLVNPSPGIARPIGWKRQAANSMLLGGGASGLVDRPRNPQRIDLVDPELVEWSEDRGWTINGEEVETWPVGPLWHVPMMLLPGSPKGVGPLEYARRTIYPGLAAHEFSGNFFRDGAHPTHVIQTKSDPGPDNAKELKRKIMNATAANNREPLVIPETVGLHQLQIDPKDSQFLDMMSFTGGEVAGFFGLMPEHVGLAIAGGTSQQYSNRENRQADLLQDAVLPVTDPLDEAISELLVGRIRVKSNRAPILRADTSNRFSVYLKNAQIQQATGQPVYTPEEIRIAEGLDPLPASTTETETAGAGVAETVQKVYLGVGTVIDADEGRQIINDAGGNLDTSRPFGTPEETQ